MEFWYCTLHLCIKIWCSITLQQNGNFIAKKHRKCTRQLIGEIAIDMEAFDHVKNRASIKNRRYTLLTAGIECFCQFCLVCNFAPLNYLNREIFLKVCKLSGTISCLIHGLLYIWTELLYLTCPHEADLFTLIMSHKPTQYL